MHRGVGTFNITKERLNNIIPMRLISIQLPTAPDAPNISPTRESNQTPDASGRHPRKVRHRMKAIPFNPSSRLHAAQLGATKRRERRERKSRERERKDREEENIWYPSMEDRPSRYLLKYGNLGTFEAHCFSYYHGEYKRISGCTNHHLRFHAEGEK